MSQIRHIILLENGNHILTSQRIFLLQDETFTIGRATSNDIVVKSDNLSREHAIFRVKSYRKYKLIHDSHEGRSLNRTFGDGEQSTQRILQHGDLIEFCGVIRGVYLSKVLNRLELFHYLEAVSIFSNFNDAAIAQIKSLKKTDTKNNFTVPSKLT